MTNPIVIERTVVYDSGKPSERRALHHRYWCPGCDALHTVSIDPDKNSLGAGWTFTGTLECPTYAPSQLSVWEGRGNGESIKRVCHTFIREGQIEFLSDCTHAMRNKTVPLPPLPDWAVANRHDDGKG